MPLHVYKFNWRGGGPNVSDTGIMLFQFTSEYPNCFASSD